VDVPPPKAIFISYARQDAGAARRIAEALRERGMEVWFDQNELRGGDAWDQKIRRQIRECALFIAVISENTESRGEGYFRLEWKLAAERTHLMADGVPFLAPVTVDSTRDSGSAVPSEFLNVQWSPLPGGLPTPDFVNQIERLLQRPRKPGSTVATRGPGRAAPAPRRSVAPWVLAGTGLAALALGIFLAVGRRPPVTLAPSPAAPVPAPEAPSVLEKSIAVLPLTNLSDEKDSAFFADGMHDELITDLASIADLKVISRTSVLQYRDTKENLRKIGRELGVTYILEGSVRHAGDRVHVNAQLIDARTDTHVWAGTFDKETPDVFLLQAALAQEIAGALQARLTPSETKRIERNRGASVEVYEKVQRARQVIFDTGAKVKDYDGAEALAKEAVEAEPMFALGWATLGHIDVAFVYRGFDRSTKRQGAAKVAIDQALQIDPDLPEGHWALGRYYETVDHALPLAESMKQARTELERAREAMPNEPHILSDISSVVFYENGDFSEAVALQKRAVELNPKDPLTVYNLGRMYYLLGRTDDAISAFDEARRLSPDFVAAIGYLTLAYLYKGDLAGARKAVDSLRPNDRSDRPVYFRWMVAYYERNAREAVRILEESPVSFFHDNNFSGPREFLEGKTLLMAGDAAQARSKFKIAEDALEKEATKDGVSHNSIQAENAAFLGDEAKALEFVKKFDEDDKNLPLRDSRSAEMHADVYAALGKPKEAVDALDYLVSTSRWESPASLRLNPLWDSLRGDPRFRKLSGAAP
jgi:TolB-like protein